MNLHKKKYNSRFIVLSLIILTLILTFWSIIFYNASKKMLEASFQMFAETTALTLSNIVEESSEDYRELLETHDTDTAFYEEMYNVFHDVTTKSDIKFAYTVQQINENEVYYIIDSVPVGAEDSTPIGTISETGTYANESFTTGEIVSSGFENYEQWGQDYLCAYSPIIDPETGEILSLVGIDIEIDELKVQLAQLRYSAIVGIALILLIVYLLLSRFSDTLVKPYVLDGLTKVYNRKFFDSYFEQVFYKSTRKRIPLSTLILDIDHFKKVNDNYGHPFGDIVLKEISVAILKSIRKTDCFARYGGEEFVVLLEHEDSESASKIANKIRENIENLSIYNQEIDENIKVTISIGVATVGGQDKSIEEAKTFGELLDRSDKALYFAKVDRNTVKTHRDVLDNLNKINLV